MLAPLCVTSLSFADVENVSSPLSYFSSVDVDDSQAHILFPYPRVSLYWLHD